MEGGREGKPRGAKQTSWLRGARRAGRGGAGQRGRAGNKLAGPVDPWTRKPCKVVSGPTGCRVVHGGVGEVAGVEWSMALEGEGAAARSSSDAISIVVANKQPSSFFLRKIHL